MKNYHTHTYLCRHANGSMEEYINKAIEGGLTTLGFSDHVPYIYGGGFHGPSAMLPEEKPIYFDTLLALREKYRDKIEIRIGFEAEYYPALFDRLIESLRGYTVEYFILGQHCIGDTGLLGGFSTFERTADPERLGLYVDTCLAAIATGRYCAIAHPDVMNFVGDEALYRSEMRRLIRGAMDRNIPLEINLHGLRTGRHYPNPVFWEEASAMGATAFLGMDCHEIDHVANPADFERAARFVAPYSLKLVDEIALVDPIG